MVAMTLLTHQSTMRSDSTLLQGQSINSPTGAFLFTFQIDQNLVLYVIDGMKPAGGVCGTGNYCIGGDQNYRVPLWASNTVHCDGIRCVMQSDGNLVI